MNQRGAAEQVDLPELAERAVLLAASLPVAAALAPLAACAWRALSLATFFGVSLLVSDIDLGPHVGLNAIITYMHYTYGRAVGQDSSPGYGPWI